MSLSKQWNEARETDAKLLGEQGVDAARNYLASVLNGVGLVDFTIGAYLLSVNESKPRTAIIRCEVGDGDEMLVFDIEVQQRIGPGEPIKRVFAANSKFGKYSARPTSNFDVQLFLDSHFEGLKRYESTLARQRNTFIEIGNLILQAAGEAGASPEFATGIDSEKLGKIVCAGLTGSKIANFVQSQDVPF